jgi:spore maturation protein CgeB
MKILLTINKTLSNGNNKWIDGGYFNVYLPLKDLGHEVYLWDTVDPEEPNYKKVINSFKPDVIFCCLTGDLSLAPSEQPVWDAVSRETEKGNIKTFNWFCDDTWRFDSFSSKACKHFSICSTPEPDYIQKYKDIGYKNIIIGGWHTNHNFYPEEKCEKKYDVTFIGQMNNPDRSRHIQYLKENGINVRNFHGLSHREMTKILTETKIGLNFSKNYNGIPVRTQMKLRPFEVSAASDTMLLTEYHGGLEHFFDIDKEIVTFNSASEMLSKINILLQKESIRAKIAAAGNSRFKKEHSSHKRMQQILQKINDI